MYLICLISTTELLIPPYIYFFFLFFPVRLEWELQGSNPWSATNWPHPIVSGTEVLKPNTPLILCHSIYLYFISIASTCSLSMSSPEVIGVTLCEATGTVQVPNQAPPLFSVNFAKFSGIDRGHAKTAPVRRTMKICIWKREN